MSFLSSFLGQPNSLIIGICLGMQLLSTSGCEGGFSSGLNFIPGIVVPVCSPIETVMGWQPLAGISQLLQDQSPFNIYQPFFYFSHSYIFRVADPSSCIASSDYLSYPAIVLSRNVVGFQFHPELSQRSGTLLLSSIFNYFF